MISLFDHIKIDNTYELFFPKKEQGLAVIWLYERVKKGYFHKGVFKEKDIQQAFDEVSLISREKRERFPWEYYNSQIMELQEFFLYYDEENQTYAFKEYATYLCDKVLKIISERFNPTVIELTCIELYEKLKDITSSEDLIIWLEHHFDKAQLHLKEQIDFLNQQIDKSVLELSEKAKLKSDNLLNALREIESKLDEIREQNKELRGAFREIDRIKTILLDHPAREVEKTDEMVTSAIDYLESIRTLLNMVDSRIDKIQPKIQQFFGSLNRRIFDTKVEKFLIHLLNNSKIVSGELVIQELSEGFSIRIAGTNFPIINARNDFSLGKKSSPISFNVDPKKENAARKQSQIALTRQSSIDFWMEKIRIESLHKDEFDLSAVFTEILNTHNGDLHLAVSVIYQAIEMYNKHSKWQIEIDKEKMIQIDSHNYTIWDIWMKRK